MYLDAAQIRMTSSSYRGYAATLRELQAAYEDEPLRVFAPPLGGDLIVRFLDERWGDRTANTYNKSHSVLRGFFAWHVAASNIAASPMDGVERRPVARSPRAHFRSADRDAILAANPDPRDMVPLLLLLDYGVQKGSLRKLRFANFHRSSSRVTLTRGNEPHAVSLDRGFWIEFDKLIKVASPDESDHVLPKQTARRYRPTAQEIATRIPKEGPPNFLRSGGGGNWMKVSVDPTQPCGEHGTHLWWYACLARGGVVDEGTTRGRRMQTARQTVGRNVLRSTGTVKAVLDQLGIGSGGSAGDVYSNRDGDELEATIRRLRRTLRRASTGLNGEEWWLDPIHRFVEYVVEERDLVELSRVSIEMLRTHDDQSPRLHEAIDALDRVVLPSQILARAERESVRDHSLLHGHSLVAAWSAMETMTLDLVATWLLHRPEARNASGVVDIKLPYSTFEGLEPHERAEVVARELDAQRGPRSGIKRFERLLRAVDLPDLETPNDSVLASNIYEMQQVRHVFAHKRGIADRDFFRACPHLGYSPGSHIVIDRDTWARAIVTGLVYAEVVLTRIASAMGVVLPLQRADLRRIAWSKSTPTRKSRVAPV